MRNQFRPVEVLKAEFESDGIGEDLYREITRLTASGLPDDDEVRHRYLRLGILSELGEVAALFKREIRDDKTTSHHILLGELGDVLWYATRIGEDIFDRRIEWSREPLLTVEPVDHMERIARGYVAETINLIKSLGHEPSEAAHFNAKKLLSRFERGVIQGEGGDR